MRFHFIEALAVGAPCGVAACVLFACANAQSVVAVSDAGASAADVSDAVAATADAGPDVSIVAQDGGQAGCSEEAKLVYVLSQEGDIYSFAPDKKIFTKLGPLSCGSGWTPLSMAVDRNAVAWVNFEPDDPNADEALFKVDTATLACAPTAFHGNLGGMGFSMNEGSTTEETLYVIGDGTGGMQGLTRANFSSQKFELVANFARRSDPELTGTADGKLFGLLLDVGGSNPMTIAKIDKTTAALTAGTDLSGVPIPTGAMYSFSFWGGDFYVYTATDSEDSVGSTVSRFRPSDGSIDTAYMTNLGFHIVGAGVSTCAPLAPPR